MRKLTCTYNNRVLGSFLQRRWLSLTPSIRELFSNPPIENSFLTVQGHVKTVRDFKNLLFIDVSDGTTHENLNIVVHKGEVPLNAAFKVGQSIKVGGKWIASKGKQEYEVFCDAQNKDVNIQVIGDVPESYPIQKKAHSEQFLRNLPTLRHRTATFASVLRTRSFLETSFLDFFNERGFTKVSPPLITSSDCEGGGEQFSVAPTGSLNSAATPEESFFGTDANLTVSTQLHLEVLCQSFSRVWTLSPCFRAEKSNTIRHLSEFWMLEAEVSYVDDLRQLTSFIEEMVRYVTGRLRNSTSDDLGGCVDLLGSRFSKSEIATIKERWGILLTQDPWPSITYSETLEIINRVKNKGRSKGRMTWGDTIQTEHEKWLAGIHYNSPVFITDYPVDQKPFYMAKSKNFDNDKPTVACFDLILPDIGELVGGSIREHKYSNLREAMENKNMNVDELEWYLSTRKNGTVPHGGFGLGFERLLSYLTATNNIRDVVAFPRAYLSCKC